MPTQELPDTLRSYQKCIIRSARFSDVAPIAESMRPMDALECHCGGHSPEEALRIGLTLDLCTFTICDRFDGTPLAMFGCGVYYNGAYIWALASDLLVPRAGRDFVRHSPEWIQAMLKEVGGTARNFVHLDNTDAARWLLYCGAGFSPEITLKNNQPFIQFTITNHV